MVYAERGNRVKQISEQDIQKYVEQGYIITDGRGTVIKETVPTDLSELKLEYNKHLAEIESLKQAIAVRDAEIAKLQKQLIEVSTSSSSQVAVETSKADTPKAETPKKKSAKAKTEEVKTEEE